MKIAILNDTHTGIRNSADVFLDNAAQFYNETFFPYLKKHGIKQIIHLGDYYDNRKAINIKALYHNRKHFLEPLRDAGISMDVITGNHDTYFKDTNTPNSLKELLGFFVNEVAIIERPTVLEYGAMKIGLLPWIATDNEEESLRFISKAKADILGGHLELNGFEMQKGIMSEHGLDRGLFRNFDRVLSGHYHTKSSSGQFSYLGSQLEFFWSDCNDKKFFHVLDTEDGSLTPVRNPHTLFKKIIYDDTKYDFTTAPDFTGHFVKVIVVNKTNPKMFEDFTEQLQNQNLHNLSIGDNFEAMIDNSRDSDVTVDDTQTLLDEYVDLIDTNLDRNILKENLRDLYVQAQSLEVL